MKCEAVYVIADSYSKAMNQFNEELKKTIERLIKENPYSKVRVGADGFQVTYLSNTSPAFIGVSVLVKVN